MTDQTPQQPANAAAPTPAQPTPGAKAKKSKVGKWLTGGLTAVVLIGLGFLGGTLVAQNSSTQASQVPSGQGGSMPSGGQGEGGAPRGESGEGGGQAAMSGFTSGTITSIDGDTITIETDDGETKTITVGSDTSVTESTSSSVDALSTGDTISVRGESDDDSITAQSITTGDATDSFPGGGQAPASE